MAKKKQKYYVVWQGHNPGIYSSWDKCHAQVKNYPNAIYKSFNSKEEAMQAFSGGIPSPSKRFTKTDKIPKLYKQDFEAASISVDAACSGNPGIMEYRGVWTDDKTEIFHLGPFKEGTNNIGEFLAIVHALALLGKKGDDKTIIYSDSQTAISWVNRKKANTKLSPSAKNTDLFDLIRRAEKWLKENTWKNPVKKWKTEDWGEIPADFGRK
ncbi:MAG TPA: ribonuclease H family protein [Saprospiraceae bacterium]|nr:ribonuclease H family protein [Saprospiraceae bacterium]